MKRIMLVLAAVACLGVMGCAKQLTREEFLALNDATNTAMVREYPGIDKERIIAACEQALKSSDTDYIITQHMENGFYAQRNWSIYMVLAFASGEDHWKITVEENQTGSKAQVRSWQGDGVSAGPFPLPIPGKSENEYYTLPSLYNLFFDRVEYFLGLRQDWETCDNAEKNLHQYEYTSSLAPLCTLASSSDPTKQQIE